MKLLAPVFAAYSVSHHKSRSFCTRLYYVAIETVMQHVKYGTHNKVTFVLSMDNSDRIVVSY